MSTSGEVRRLFATLRQALKGRAEGMAAALREAPEYPLARSVGGKGAGNKRLECSSVIGALPASLGGRAAPGSHQHWDVSVPGFIEADAGWRTAGRVWPESFAGA